MAQPGPRPSRFDQGFDESMEETLKPSRGRQQTTRAQNIFQDMRRESNQRQPEQSTSTQQDQAFYDDDSFNAYEFPGDQDFANMMPMNNQGLMAMNAAAVAYNLQQQNDRTQSLNNLSGSASQQRHQMDSSVAAFSGRSGTRRLQQAPQLIDTAFLTQPVQHPSRSTTANHQAASQWRRQAPSTPQMDQSFGGFSNQNDLQRIQNTPQSIVSSNSSQYIPSTPQTVGNGHSSQHFQYTPHSVAASAPNHSQPPSPSPMPASHRRSQSIASVSSVNDLNVEDTRTPTNVTQEEIAQYIEGPDEADGKWVCIHPECNRRRFGRKENIKSHIQTHLDDRQYQCPVCNKCFVRQHDLTRHAKIHTGVKPYPCKCGNSFARHDALTRHRQRGMCIGAYDGVVRKNVKRGRPRKNRPDIETRQEKSAATRRKNNMSISSVSSFSTQSSYSAYSDCSIAQSPGDTGLSQLDTFIAGLGAAPTMTSTNNTAAWLSSAPMPSSPFQAATSPVGVPSYAPAAPMMVRTPSYGGSSVSHTDPPELSQSVSPLSARFLSAEPSLSAGMDEANALTASANAMMTDNFLESLPENMHDDIDDELLSQFLNVDEWDAGRRSSTQQPNKFDADFGNVGVFNNDHDVFFDKN